MTVASAKKRERFAKCPMDVLEADISNRALRAYLVIRGHGSEIRGDCRAEQETLADAMQCGPRNFRSALAELVAADLIQVERGPSRSGFGTVNVYRWGVESTPEHNDPHRCGTGRGSGRGTKRSGHTYIEERTENRDRSIHFRESNSPTSNAEMEKRAEEKLAYEKAVKGLEEIRNDRGGTPEQWFMRCRTRMLDLLGTTSGELFEQIKSAYEDAEREAKDAGFEL